MLQYFVIMKIWYVAVLFRPDGQSMFAHCRNVDIYSTSKSLLFYHISFCGMNFLIHAIFAQFPNIACVKSL